MRGARAFITLTIALILLAAFSYALYRIVVAATQYSSSPLSPQVGQTLFAGLAFLELIIISAITPAITSGAISSEKERLTYEMLLATPLPSVHILWGKLITALSYIFLIVFAAIPLASLVFIFGGVTGRDMVKGLIVLIIVTVMYGVIGLFSSTVLGSTSRATVTTYLIVILMLFGPIFISIAAGIIHQSDPPRWILIPSPISALASALSPSANPQNISSIFWMLGSPASWIWGTPSISLTSIPRPLYHYSLPLFGCITLLFYLLSTHMVKPSRRWQIHWPEVLVISIVIIGFVGLIALAFLSSANRYEYFLIK